ncbi:MAG: PKD domain-containing protein [Candidatus Sulfotelmatobacter sp.]
MNRTITTLLRLSVFLAALAAASLAQTNAAGPEISNSSLSVSLRSKGAIYQVKAQGLEKAVFSGRLGAQVDHKWLWSTDYAQAHVAASDFSDQLGSGHRLEVTFAAVADRPEMKYTVELYDQLPFGDVQLQLQNKGKTDLQVQSMRVLDSSGTPVVNLGAPESSERVLSDSFSEDMPTMRISDLGKALEYQGDGSFSDQLTPVHFAVGSQLIYNRTSRYGLLLAALTSDRWVTFYHLATEGGKAGQARTTAYAADCTGTTEALKKESLRESPDEQKIELSLAVKPGETISSEKVMFSVGKDYHSQLETYASAIRTLHNARVSKPSPWGWWSWTAYYSGLTGGAALTNAEWLAQNLKTYGYDMFHIDNSYQYAYGEYSTPNAALFPNGVRSLGYAVTSLGLRFALWVAPFEVSERSYVFEKHPEWLVHDAQGNPIQAGYNWGTQALLDRIYVLDATHPGAQEYLRQTYSTLSRNWNARYIKLDFMDETAVEGYYYRPNTSAFEALHIGLKVIRDAVGPDVLLDKDGSPMLVPVGYTEFGRISADAAHSYRIIKQNEVAIAARYYMNGNFYGADPDAFTVSSSLTEEARQKRRSPLSANEAEMSIMLAAVAGGMFEIGDDLSTLAAEPERLQLLKNQELLNMVRLARSAKPVDLMTYREEDEQPSVFFLREDDRQSMLVVFNWTESARSHKFTLADLGFSATDATATDVLHPERTLNVANGVLAIDDLASRSVRMIKLVNNTVSASAPTVDVEVGGITDIAQTAEFRAVLNPAGVPAVGYHWDFGDGTTTDGSSVVEHAYTRKGNFEVSLKVDGLDGLATTRKIPVTVGGTLKTIFDVRDSRRYQEQ